MSEPVRVSGGVTDVAERAWRWWPIGLAVAVVTVVVGMVLTWETPRVFVSRATVFPPVSVANAVAGQRFINDMQAAINSFTVRDEVAEELGVPRSAFGDQVEVRRIRQSTVMDVIMQSPDELPDPSQALNTLIERAALSLAAPEVAAAEAQRTRADDAVAAAEDKAVAAKAARNAFLEERNAVTPASELESLTPELADLRLCASGAIVVPGSDPDTCQAEVARLQEQVTQLGQADDELAALDRELAQAESEVTEATRLLREAEAAAIRAESGPTVEIAGAGEEVSQLPGLLRRGLAIVGGALLLGFAVIVAIALLAHPDRRPRSTEKPQRVMPS